MLLKYLLEYKKKKNILKINLKEEVEKVAFGGFAERRSK
jgi:hypothetical protein